MSESGLGVFLPTFCDTARRSGEEIGAFARRAEELGFNSVWATDHLLHGSLFYRGPWLEPLSALSFAAAVTRRVRLGTSILVMPARHPVSLAKEVSTLQALSGDRYILGVGTGWDEREFQAVGVSKRERGGRTDESLSLVRRLLAGEVVTSSGGYFALNEVSVGPPMPHPVTVWVGGGRQLPHAKSPEAPRLAPAVLRRIVDADGWIARPTATHDQIREDLNDIVAALDSCGKAVDRCTVAHENFLHLVPTDDPAVARREQKHFFTQVMGEQRPFEYFESVYLTGTEREVIEKLQSRRSAGVTQFMLHTLESSTDQLELWSKVILPEFGVPAP